MEKYCPNCNFVSTDSNANYCTICGTQLIEREGRQPIPRQLRHKIFKRDNYTCQDCGAHKDEEGVSLEIDHITPVSKGGTNDEDNLQTLCKECNRAKYTDEWVGGQTSLEIVEKQYTRLLNRKHQYEQKLQVTSDEDEIIELNYKIMRLNERLNQLQDKIQKLRDEKEELKLQKEKEEKKDKLFKKLYVTLTDAQLILVSNNFEIMGRSKDQIIKYLVDNYSEIEINRILIKLQYRSNLSKKLQDTLTKSQLELLYDEFPQFNNSKDNLITYLSENYIKREIYQMLYRLQKEKEEKEQLSKNLFDNLKENELKLLYDEFPQFNNSKDYLISYLSENYFENEIYQILSRLQKENEHFLEKIYKDLSDSKFQLLCIKFNYEGSKKEFIDYLNNNYSKSEINQIFNESEKDLLFKKLSSNDEELELLTDKIYRGSRSKEEFVRYVCDNYSEDEIYQKISQSMIEKEEKEQVLKKLHDLNDNQLKVLYKKYPIFDNSKEKIVDYLCKAYSIKQIDSLLEEIQEEIQKKLESEKEAEKFAQNLAMERMALSIISDSSYMDESYQKLADELQDSYNESQILEILNGIYNINQYLIEFNKQEDMGGFCILGFSGVWYYYYITLDGEYDRFYAFSKSELKIEALSKNLPWYDKTFRYTPLSYDEQVSKFISTLCNKLELTVKLKTPHEIIFSECSASVTSKMLHDIVICHLGPLSNYEPSKDLFKPVIYLNFIKQIVGSKSYIICPNCGSKIPKKAVRCKYCKTMMKDLFKIVNNELELYGYNLNEFIIV